MTRSFGVFFDIRLNKRLSKKYRHRWFETPSRSLWCHCVGKVILIAMLTCWTFIGIQQANTMSYNLMSYIWLIILIRVLRQKQISNIWSSTHYFFFPDYCIYMRSQEPFNVTNCNAIRLIIGMVCGKRMLMIIHVTKETPRDIHVPFIALWIPLWAQSTDAPLLYNGALALRRFHQLDYIVANYSVWKSTKKLENSPNICNFSVLT